MKKKTLIIPIALMFLFVGCTPSSGNGNNKGTSVEPSPSEQSVPNYDGIPDYGPYSGTPGVGGNQLQTIDITPKGKCYAFVGDVVTIKGTVNGAVSPSIPAEQIPISYTVSDESLVELDQAENSNNVDVTFLAVGDVTITAHSYQNRFTRDVTYHICPTDGSVDYFLPDLSTTTKANKEKAKFGWENTDDDTKKGISEGDAELGSYTWHFVRSERGTVGTYGGGFSFGRGNKEGRMTFSTTFTRAIKTVVIQCSSASAKDPVTGYSVNHGWSTFDAWFGEDDHLERIVDGVTYAPGEECFTSKFSSDENTSYHTINCNSKTGAFTFELGPSQGAIYLKSILIEYAE